MAAKYTASNYMLELVDYGGTLVPRGYVLQLLIEVAAAQGHDAKHARVLADRWMQGHDLRKKLAASVPVKIPTAESGDA